MTHIEAMKLTDPHDHPEPHTMKWTQLEMDYINKRVEAAVRQAIEQAEQAQPVVWMYQDKSTHEVRFQKHMSAFVDHSRTSEVPLYGEPLANHELQCVCGAVWCGDEMVHLPNKTPPRQPWIGLTDEEIEQGNKESWVTEQAWQSALSSHF